MSRRVYGFNDQGQPVQAPKGWQLLPEGVPIPQVHRCFISDINLWAAPRHCHSTMTPLKTRVWGNETAYAVPLPTP
jgi:hypothetical protein